MNRTFAIAATAVTVAQFQGFRPEHPYSKEHAPTTDCPVNGTTWHDAAAYCNWLSQKEGLDPCYEISAIGKVSKLKENYLSLTGYRLPTEAEWEFACRAQAKTSWYYGQGSELMTKYGWHYANS